MLKYIAVITALLLASTASFAQGISNIDLKQKNEVSDKLDKKLAEIHSKAGIACPPPVRPAIYSGVLINEDFCEACFVKDSKISDKELGITIDFKIAQQKNSAKKQIQYIIEFADGDLMDGEIPSSYKYAAENPERNDPHSPAYLKAFITIPLKTADGVKTEIYEAKVLSMYKHELPQNDVSAGYSAGSESGIAVTDDEGKCVKCGKEVTDIEGKILKPARGDLDKTGKISTKKALK